MIGYRALVFIASSITAATAALPRSHPSSLRSSGQALARSHEIRMMGGRFAPYELTIERGDTVRFVLGAGGPHNVAFRETKGEAAARLRKRMTDTIADLAGPLLVLPGESYVIVFSDMPPGKYPYWCIPHLAMGMMGSITVR